MYIKYIRFGDAWEIGRRCWTSKRLVRIYILRLQTQMKQRRCCHTAIIVILLSAAAAAVSLFYNLQFLYFIIYLYCWHFYFFISFLLLLINNSPQALFRSVSIPLIPLLLLLLWIRLAAILHLFHFIAHSVAKSYWNSDNIMLLLLLLHTMSAYKRQFRFLLLFFFLFSREWKTIHASEPRTHIILNYYRQFWSEHRAVNDFECCCCDWPHE